MARPDAIKCLGISKHRNLLEDRRTDVPTRSCIKPIAGVKGPRIVYEFTNQDKKRFEWFKPINNELFGDHEWLE
jgi:hypothetical protein